MYLSKAMITIQIFLNLLDFASMHFNPFSSFFSARGRVDKTSAFLDNLCVGLFPFVPWLLPADIPQEGKMKNDREKPPVDACFASYRKEKLKRYPLAAP